MGSDSGVVVLDARTGKLKKNISAPKIFPGFSSIVDIEFSRTGRNAFVVNTIIDQTIGGQGVWRVMRRSPAIRCSAR